MCVQMVPTRKDESIGSWHNSVILIELIATMYVYVRGRRCIHKSIIRLLLDNLA